MPYSVRVKFNHPYGEYRRGGITFHTQAQILAKRDVTEEMLNDPWLIVEESDEKVTFVRPEVAQVETPVAPIEEPLTLEPNTSSDISVSTSDESLEPKADGNPDAEGPASNSDADGR